MSWNLFWGRIYIPSYSALISRDIFIIFNCHKKHMLIEYFVKKQEYRNRNTLSETILPQYIMQKLRNKISSYWQLARNMYWQWWFGKNFEARKYWGIAWSGNFETPSNGHGHIASRYAIASLIEPEHFWSLES